MIGVAKVIIYFGMLDSKTVKMYEIVVFVYVLQSVIHEFV